jgi:hypothetical protein
MGCQQRPVSCSPPPGDVPALGFNVRTACHLLAVAADPADLIINRRGGPESLSGIVNES